MFFARKKEFQFLEDQYMSQNFQIHLVFGRSGVGKTSFVNEFIKDKNAVYFSATEFGERQNFLNFSDCVFTYLGREKDERKFSDFTEVLEYLFEISKYKRLVLVLDNYTLLQKFDKNFYIKLQNLIDKNKEESKMFIIFSGSPSYISKDDLVAISTDFDSNFTDIIEILPFSFDESLQCFKKFSKEQVLAIYNMVGGFPKYLLRFNESLTFEENVKLNILSKDSYLFEECTNILKNEFREISLYVSIITAIANGKKRLGEIAEAVGEKTSFCAASIKKLMMIGILKKEIPVIGETDRKTSYSVENKLFKFWSKYIYPYYSYLENNQINYVYGNIHKEISSNYQDVLEEICKDYLRGLNKAEKLPIKFDRIGKWWSDDFSKNIDIVCINNESEAILCKCDWSGVKTQSSDIYDLIESAKSFDFSTVYLYIFSNIGFTDECIKITRKENWIKLVIV